MLRQGDIIEEIDRFIELSRHNLFALQSNLLDLGYRFANLKGGLQLADDEAKGALKRLTLDPEDLPLLYRKWYECFAWVDFSQDPNQLNDSSKNDISGLGLNCPLIYLDIDSCLRLRLLLNTMGVVRQEQNALQFIPFGSSASNCQPRGIWIPAVASDPVVYDAGVGPVKMSQEITGALRAGGFPFWAHMFRRRRFASPIEHVPNYEKLLPRLLKDLRID